MSKIYFVGTAHEQYRQREFAPGDVVIDPWRMIPDQTGVTVRRLGENRPALISVLMPSRDRPYKMAETLRTALNTAIFNRQIEFVLWLDDDDPQRKKYISIQQNTYSRWLRIIGGPRQLLSSCWNDCYVAAGGEILMHAGDDITFQTPGWDQMVRDAFNAIPDRIGLVYGNDLSTNFPELATHGFLHRRWVEAVGYFLPPLFSCDWNDVWISEVAREIGRAVPLPEMVIEHQHYTFDKRERDQTDLEREERGRQDDVVELYKRTAKKRRLDEAKLRAVMA